MTEAQAHALIARLIAAFPQQRIEQATVTVYAEHLARLDNAETALEAVHTICLNEEWFPTIAAIRRAYRAEHDRRQRAARPALEQAPLSEQERQDNLRRIRDLLNTIGKPVNANHPA